MNSSLLAVLGVVILIVIVLILKMRGGKSKPDVRPEGEQEGLEEAKEQVVSEVAADRVDEAEAVESVTEQAPAPVAEERTAEPVDEEALSEKEIPEALPEEMEEEALALETEAEPAEARREADLVEEPLLTDEAIAVEDEIHLEVVVEEESPEATNEEESVKGLEAVEVEQEIESIAEPVVPEPVFEEPSAEDALSLEVEAQEETQTVPVAPEEETFESMDAAETEEPLEPKVELVAAEETPEEPVPTVPASDEPVDAAVVEPEQVSPEKTADAVMSVQLSMEEYAERLNNLEEQQRAALAEAIANNDDQLRDQLQRELVVMNDRLSLVADYYAEDMAACQQVLDALVRLQADEPGPELSEAITELQSGQTEAAAAFLDGMSRKEHPFAAQAAFYSGQLAESRVDLQKAMGFYRQAVTQNPQEPAYLRAAGLMARGMYKYKEALPWLESYVNLVKENGQADAEAVALAQRELAYTYVLSGQYQKSGPLYKESMTTLAQKLGQDHPEMALSWQQIGEFQETMGEYDKAVSLYKKALAILEKKRGPEHPALAGILRKLAALCIELELEPEAVPLYEKLVRIQEKTLRSTHPQLAISLNSLAEAYRLQGRYADAEGCYQKTLRINEELHGKEHPSVGAILQELAKLCNSQRKPEEARQYQERASAIFQKSVEEAEKQAGDEEALTLELS